MGRKITKLINFLRSRWLILSILWWVSSRTRKRTRKISIILPGCSWIAQKTIPRAVVVVYTNKPVLLPIESSSTVLFFCWVRRVVFRWMVVPKWRPGCCLVGWSICIAYLQNDLISVQPESCRKYPEPRLGVRCLFKLSEESRVFQSSSVFAPFQFFHLEHFLHQLYMCSLVRNNATCPIQERNDPW